MRFNGFFYFVNVFLFLKTLNSQRENSGNLKHFVFRFIYF